MPQLLRMQVGVGLSTLMQYKPVSRPYTAYPFLSLTEPWLPCNQTEVMRKQTVCMIQPLLPQYWPLYRFMNEHIAEMNMADPL